MFMFATCFILWSFCTGFVIGKKKVGKRKASDKSEEDSGCWETNAKFQNVTFWNHDSLPSQDDAFLRTFHWLAVAKAVCFYLTWYVLVDLKFMMAKFMQWDMRSNFHYFNGLRMFFTSAHMCLYLGCDVSTASFLKFIV